MHSLSTLSQFLLVLAVSHLAAAAPLPQGSSNRFKTITTGMGGISPGGSVNNNGGLQKGGLEVLNVGSNNAGAGGDASSGSSVSVSKAGSSVPDYDCANGHDEPTTGTGKTSQSGNGGSAGGGSVTGMGGLINVFSGNAGDGGNAKSGDVKEVGAVGNRAFSRSFQILRSSKTRVAARKRALRSRVFRLDY